MRVTRQPLFCAVPVRGGFPARGQKKGGAGETPARPPPRSGGQGLQAKKGGGGRDTRTPPLKRSGYCMRCTTTLATGSLDGA